MVHLHALAAAISPGPRMMWRSAPVLLRAHIPSAVAPSGVAALPLVQQSAVVGGILLSLGAGSAVMTSGLLAAGDAIWERPGGTKTIVGGGIATLLGAAFCLAGYSHFAFSHAYEAIYPPEGTWGFWYLPGSASFHVAWTGVAEIAGGLGLLLGGLGDLSGDPLSGGRARPLRQLSASALFALMFAVSPANIYQFSAFPPALHALFLRGGDRAAPVLRVPPLPLSLRPQLLRVFRSRCLCSPRRGDGRRRAGRAAASRLPLCAAGDPDCAAERAELAVEGGRAHPSRRRRVSCLSSLHGPPVRASRSRPAV